MFGFGKKPKARFEISWPMESNRDHELYAHPPRREAPLPPIPTQSEASSPRSAHSSASSHSSYFTSHSTEEHDQHTPVISIPPRTYMMAEISRSSPVHAQHQRPTTSSTKDSRHSPSSSHSSQPSFASSNTMYTARRGSTAALSLSSCDDGSCQLDDPGSEQMFEQLQNQMQVSDNLPDAKAIESAGEIPIFDSEGNSQPFKSIYSGELALGEQQMVLFVRHFFCSACQAYIRLLCKSISLQTYFTLPIPTSITIIGLGSPQLINSYRTITGTQFPIYADPTKKLYKALGMSWTINIGPRVDYNDRENEYQWVKGQLKQVIQAQSGLRSKAGNIFWVGGEFMFKDGKPVWCHRMKNYRGHSRIDTIKKLLGAEDEVVYHAM